LKYLFSKIMRELLRDYILILANTGMRHGTEAQNLRWKNISTFEMDGRSYVAMYGLLPVPQTPS
jgi:integrase